MDMDSEELVLGYGISLIILNVGMYFVAPVVVIHTIRKNLNPQVQNLCRKLMSFRVSIFSKKEGAIIIGISVIGSSILYISYVTSR